MWSDSGGKRSELWQKQKSALVDKLYEILPVCVYLYFCFFFKQRICVNFLFI